MDLIGDGFGASTDRPPLVQPQSAGFCPVSQRLSNKQVPLGAIVHTHSFGSPKPRLSPAQLCLLVPQSFMPLLAMPAAFLKCRLPRGLHRSVAPTRPRARTP